MSDTTKLLNDRLKLSDSAFDFVKNDEKFSQAYKKIFNFKTIEPFLGSRTELITDYNDKLSEKDKSLILDLVNRGVFKKEKIPNLIRRIVYGWTGAPETPDERVYKIITLQINSIMRPRPGRPKKDPVLGEYEEEDKRPRKMKVYSRVEGLEIENGFREFFDERMAEMKKSYDLDTADTTVLRLLVSSEVELEHVMYKQAKGYSDAGLKRAAMLLEIIKTCLETLKLARRQRNDRKDDSVERDIAEKYKENRDSPKILPPEELRATNEAKKAIAAFIEDSTSDDDDVQELCPMCFDINCDGTCNDDIE